MNRIITITKERLNKAKTPKGGFNAKQLRVLGIDFPPKKGWQKELIGEKITLFRFIEFVRASKNKVYLQEIELLLPTLNPPINEIQASSSATEAINPKLSKQEKISNKRKRKKEAKKIEAANKVNEFGILPVVELLKEHVSYMPWRIKAIVQELESGKHAIVEFDYANAIYNVLKQNGVLLVKTASGKVVTSNYTKIKKLQSEQYLYVIRATTSELLKIGVAIDPQKRLRALQTSSPFNLRIALIFETVKSAVKLERYLHHYFSSRNTSGEWFRDITNEEIIEAIGKRAALKTKRLNTKS